ncbi:hypothetical protein BD626DRAFT_489221 [Schizophyllum amplum]|uniref:C2H2-type domain-containing protein n=1 Tax=Schizophyllum amplum TaxID=97359 RepID=A0A550CLF4_9AGAR|nr:hypothetical protein BD626DRAFT_489221 [Auriculariopsis ampla]
MYPAGDSKLWFQHEAGFVSEPVREKSGRMRSNLAQPVGVHPFETLASRGISRAPSSHDPYATYFEESPQSAYRHSISYSWYAAPGAVDTSLARDQSGANPFQPRQTDQRQGRYEGPAPTWGEYHDPVAMPSESRRGEYPSGAASHATGRAGVAHTRSVFQPSYSEPLRVAGRVESVTDDGRSRHRMAPTHWAESPRLETHEHPAARDGLRPGSRFDGRTDTASARLYSTLAGALTPVSPGHVHTPCRQQNPAVGLAIPSSPARSTLAAASAPVTYSTSPPLIGQSYVALDRSNTTGSGSSTTSSPPSSPKDKKSPLMRPPKMHQCPICQKWFPRPGGLQTHMNSHNNVKPYVCGFHDCSLRFTVQSNARRHRRNTHGAEFALEWKEAERRQPPKELAITFDDPVVNSQTYLEAPRQLMWLPPTDLTALEDEQGSP